MRKPFDNFSYNRSLGTHATEPGFVKEEIHYRDMYAKISTAALPVALMGALRSRKNASTGHTRRAVAYGAVAVTAGAITALSVTMAAALHRSSKEAPKIAADRGNLFG